MRSGECVRRCGPASAYLQIAAEEVECPTCGAHYQNSIAERFAIAADEGRCEELLLRIVAARAKSEERLQLLSSEYAAVASQFNDVGRLLEQRRESVRFADIIQSEGHQQAGQAIAGELEASRRVLGDRLAKVSEFENLVGKFSDEQRRSRIKQELREQLDKFYIALDVESLKSDKLRQIESPPKSTGSEQPRALLAYYFAILAVGGQNASGTKCPLVIDSPNQQAQDEIRLEKMLRFILANRPKDTQLILATERLPDDIEVSGDVVVLESRYRLLTEEAFPDAQAEHAGLVARALS